MAAHHVIIRRMSESDIAGAIALIRPQHWNQTEADWRRFLALEPEGCFVATVDGTVVATTTTELFDCVGWIGMVTVTGDLRGGGIGRAMMDRAIAYLHGAGARTIKLDATPMGKPLYDRMGFRPEYRVERYRRAAEPLPATGIIPLDGDTGLWSAAQALDHRAYHTDRSRMLRLLAHGWPELAAVHVSSGEVDGYVVGRHGHLYEHIGPLVAANASATEQLLRWGMTCSPGHEVIVDRPDSNGPACDLLRAHGFEPLREFTRMHLGQEPYLDEPTLIFGTSGAEKG
ncbi:MAG: GNAT family N-acetyltransferase [Anaerolineae bacterium]